MVECTFGAVVTVKDEALWSDDSVPMSHAIDVLAWGLSWGKIMRWGPGRRAHMPPKSAPFATKGFLVPPLFPSATVQALWPRRDEW